MISSCILRSTTHNVGFMVLLRKWRLLRSHCLREKRVSSKAGQLSVSCPVNIIKLCAGVRFSKKSQYHMFKTMHLHSTVLPKLTTETVLQLEFNSKLHRSQSSSFASAHDDYYTACCVLCISRVILTHADDDCNSARMRNRWVGEACLSWEGQSTPVSLTNELYFGLPLASVLLCCL